MVKKTYTRAYSKMVSWVDENWYVKRYERLEAIEKLKPHKPKKALDFGCNTGFFADMMRKGLDTQAFGTDINEAAMERGSNMFPEISFLKISELESKKGEFDAITMSHVLEHVPDCHETLTLLKNLLSENGRLVIAVPQERVRGDCSIPHIVLCSIQRRKWTNPHIRVIKKKQLTELLEKAGMEIESYKYSNFIPPFLSKRYYWPIAISLVAVCKKK